MNKPFQEPDDFEEFENFSDFDDFEEFEDFPPGYAIQWRSGFQEAYYSELRKRAAQAGLLETHIMQEKIQQARDDALAAQQDAQEAI